MLVNRLLIRLERLDSRINREYFQIILGRPCDSKAVAKCESDAADTSRRILSARNGNDIRMYCIARLALSETSRQFLEISRRKASITAADPATKKNITWNRYAGNRMPEERKDSLMRQFIRNTKEYSGIVVERFRKIDRIFREYNTSVPEYFERMHRCRIADVKRAIADAQREAGRNRKDGLTELGEGRLHEDFYAKRTACLGSIRLGRAHASRLLKHLSLMGMDAARLRFSRGTGGAGTAYCGLIRIPDRIFIYIPDGISKLEGMYSLLHEIGHAFFFQSVPASAQFSRKYCYSIELIEFYPILMQNLLCSEGFCEQVIGLSREQSAEAALSVRKVNMLSKEFYSINAGFKLGLWKDTVPGEDALDSMYAESYHRTTGFRMPGRYWLLNHMMPLNLMHSVSIFKALARAERFEARLKNEFGAEWWKEKRAYAYLRSLMKQGAGVKAKEFIASI